MSDNEETAAGEPPRPPHSESKVDVPNVLGLLVDWNTEITQFYLRRCQQYWTVAMRLQSCAKPDDIQEVQSAFMRELTDDYRGVATRLSEIAGGPAVHGDRTTPDEYAVALQKAQSDAAAILRQAKVQAERILASAQQEVARVEHPNGSQVERGARIA